MKNIKRIKPLLLLSSLILASCGTKSKDISLYIYDFKDVFIRSVREDITRVLSQRGYEYDIHDAQLSQITQNEQIIEDMDNKNSDVFIVNLVDRLSTSALIEKANKYNYPIIFFNREPLAEDMNKGRVENKNLFYVGTDPVYEGVTQAQMVMELFGGPEALDPKYDKNGDGVIQVLLVKGEISHQDTEKRTQGVIDEFKRVGYKINIVDSVYCNWSRNLAKQTMPDIMRDFGKDIEVVISNNDDMALGVIEYLQEEYSKTRTHPESSLKEESSYPYNNSEPNNSEPETEGPDENFTMPFPIVGVDGIAEGLKSIQDGYLYGTVKNNGKKQAETIVSLVDYIFGKDNALDGLKPNELREYAYYIKGEKITKEILDQNPQKFQ